VGQFLIDPNNIWHMLMIARNSEALNEVVSQMQPAAKEAGQNKTKIHGKQQE
jgi:hypothetical protein